MELSEIFTWATFNWAGLIYCAFVYVYFVVFVIRNTIIEKLTNLYIYNDPDFANHKNAIRGDWDSLNYGKFIGKYPVIFALIKEFLIILTLPVFMAMFGIFVFGNFPVKTELDPSINVSILKEIIGGCYLFAILGNIFHFINFKKYKQIASMKKNLWEAKSILQIVHRKINPRIN